jgi:hypothetical protein
VQKQKTENLPCASVQNLSAVYRLWKKSKVFIWLALVSYNIQGLLRIQAVWNINGVSAVIWIFAQFSWPTEGLLTFQISYRYSVGCVVASPRPCVNFMARCSWCGGGLLAPPSNPQPRGPHLVSCPRLPTQYVRSYPPLSRQPYEFNGVVSSPRCV